MSPEQSLDLHGGLGLAAQVFTRLTRNVTAATVAPQPESYRVMAVQAVRDLQAHLAAMEATLVAAAPQQQHQTEAA